MYRKLIKGENIDRSVVNRRRKRILGYIESNEIANLIRENPIVTINNMGKKLYLKFGGIDWLKIEHFNHELSSTQMSNE